MAIYVTGDTHIPHDVRKLYDEEWKVGATLTKDDYLIVLGDFGLIWENVDEKEEQHWTDWLNNKAWTTLFIDGNHENHHRLNRLSKVEMFGDVVGKVSDSIYHLKRGKVYTIQNKKFFCMGGALSIDKENRIEGISWWREERPSYAEKSHGLDNLEKHKNKVDYLLSHTLPFNLLPELGINLYEGHKWYDDTCKYLQHIYDNVKFKKGYCGHWHEDTVIKKYTIVYEDILKIC